MRLETTEQPQQPACCLHIVWRCMRCPSSAATDAKPVYVVRCGKLVLESCLVWTAPWGASGRMATTKWQLSCEARSQKCRGLGAMVILSTNPRRRRRTCVRRAPPAVATISGAPPALHPHAERAPRPPRIRRRSSRARPAPHRPLRGPPRMSAAAAQQNTPAKRKARPAARACVCVALAARSAQHAARGARARCNAPTRA